MFLKSKVPVVPFYGLLLNAVAVVVAFVCLIAVVLLVDRQRNTNTRLLLHPNAVF